MKNIRINVGKEVREETLVTSLKDDSDCIVKIVESPKMVEDTRLKKSII